MNDIDRLLPCPFCSGGANVVQHEVARSTYEWQVYCTVCNAHPGEWSDDKARAIGVWNTRDIAGHVVTFYREEANVISPDRVWLVLANSRMYGVCVDHRDVVKEVINRWDDEALLVG